MHGEQLRILPHVFGSERADKIESMYHNIREHLSCLGIQPSRGEQGQSTSVMPGRMTIAMGDDTEHDNLRNSRVLSAQRSEQEKQASCSEKLLDIVAVMKEVMFDHAVRTVAALAVTYFVSVTFNAMYGLGDKDCKQAHEDGDVWIFFLTVLYMLVSFALLYAIRAYWPEYWQPNAVYDKIAAYIYHLTECPQCNRFDTCVPVHLLSSSQ